MTLNINTENTVLQVQLDSGISLPITFQPSIRLEFGERIGGLVNYDSQIRQWVLEQIQSAIQPSSPREVMNCIAVDYCIDDRTSPETIVSGKTYYSHSDDAIYKGENNALVKIADYDGVIGNGVVMLEKATEDYEYQFCVFFDEDGDIGFDVFDPDENLVYAAQKYNTDGTTTSKIYRYNGTTELFEDVASEGSGYVDGNTIYINDIDTELDDYTDTAIYTVYVTKKVMFGAGTQIYTFIVTRGSKVVYPTRLRVTYYNQVLMNNDGYLFRTKTQGGSWGEWQKNIYATEEMVKKAIKLAKAAL